MSDNDMKLPVAPVSAFAVAVEVDNNVEGGFDCVDEDKADVVELVC
jgi:hypothetical protein